MGRQASGRDETIDDVNEAADAADDSGAILDDLVGPFYDVAGVTRYLNLGDGALAEQVAANELIAVPLASGAPVFPVWQFTADRRVHAALLTVWRTLRRAADPWTAACWMCAPAWDFDGRTAIAYLTDIEPLASSSAPRRLATVVALAAADGDRWLQ